MESRKTSNVKCYQTQQSYNIMFLMQQVIMFFNATTIAQLE